MINPSDLQLKNQFLQAESQLNRLKSSYDKPSDGEHQKLKKAAQEFEGVFIKQLLDVMDKTVERSGLLDGGSAEETFRGMLNDEIAKSISTRPGGSGFGLAEVIYRQMDQAMKAEQQNAQPNQTTVDTKG
jgi:Rod binding domain-containing protein